MEEKVYNIDKLNKIAGASFRLDEKSIADGKCSMREEFRTEYAYWVTNKNMPGGVKHRVGYWKDGKFFTRLRYASDRYEETAWNDYEYQDPETGRTKNFFEKRYTGVIHFKEPTEVMLWDSDERKEVPTTVTTAWLTLSPSQYEKMQRVLHDKRSNVSDYVVFNYDANAALAERYTCEWDDTFEGGPTSSPVTNVATNVVTEVTLTADERTTLTEIDGISATVESVIDYLMASSDTTQERALEIAQACVTDGVVTLP